MKKFSLVVLALAALCAAALGLFIYQTEYRPSAVTESVSPDGEYTVTVTMLGDPVFPFGPARCRFDLLRGRERITRYPFEVMNDGGCAAADGFSFVWGSDTVEVTVSAEEHPDTLYALSFDGSVEQRDLWE